MSEQPGAAAADVPVAPVATIDPRDTPAFDEWFAVWHVTDLERTPGGPGWQYEERLAMALDEDGPEENRPLVARRDGAVIGVANLKMFRRENHHLARLEVRVLREHRRRGIGTELLRTAERLAAASGRNELAGMDETPVREGYVDAAGPFARRLGFTVAQRMVRRCIDLPLDDAHATALVADPRATPAGYTLVTFADRWPDEYLRDRCELGRRMSTDVPVGEQEVDEEVWDTERVRALEASLAAQNRAKVTTAARHDASGRLVGFTEVAIPLGAPESAWQHDTLVMREHRGHGLGFAMKVANVVAVQERYPSVRRINTWNAAENAPMIAVNDEMGWRVEAHSAYWHRPIAVRPSHA
ncbi:MAG TPA: GNAT family N-acetyltransferase [Acidimicrobiales bacterium]|nr:GNAT family N-acetyltransferase [Acidimicrobiales bacterium]